jgi:hypothetical protein
MQDEIGSFIVGIAAAVAKKYFRLVETADRKPQTVTYRFECAACFGISNDAHFLSSHFRYRGLLNQQFD